MLHRRIGPILFILGFAVSAGCTSNTYRLTLEMPPSNFAIVQIGGRRPFGMVTNQGPGAVDVTFAIDDEPNRLRRTLQAGESGQRTLRGPRRFKVETGPDQDAEVVIEARHATTIRLQGPVPLSAEQ